MMKDLKCDVSRSVLEKKRERDDRKEREKEEEEEKGGGGIILITPPKTTQAPIDFIPPLSSHPETLYVQYGVHAKQIGCGHNCSRPKLTLRRTGAERERRRCQSPPFAATLTCYAVHTYSTIQSGL